MDKRILISGEIYHVFTKSIAEFKIFNNAPDFSRMLDTIRYYQRKNPPINFSKINKTQEQEIPYDRESVFKIPDTEKLVEIIAYCLMPTHLHLILKQIEEKGISNLMNKVLNSYTRYFNIKHNRKGPLWEGRFKTVLVASDEQLLHLTRYIHLNPVTAYLVDNPLDWNASSYKEYIFPETTKDKICKYEDVLDINPILYKKFTEDLISYQRDLAKIKKLALD